MRILLTILICLSFLPACQKASQGIRPSANSQPNTIETGGGDSGGGGVIKLNGKLRLKDFENCEVSEKFKIKETINYEVIASDIKKADNASLKKLVLTKTSNQSELLQKLIVMGSARSTWYFVDKNLKWSNAKPNETTIAIYKRPSGILVHSKLFDEIPVEDQSGLILHESIRMMSIGFGLEISTEKIEEMVCKIARQEKINSDDYFNLNDFFNKQLPLDNRSLEEIKTVFFSIADYLIANDSNYPQFGRPIFFIQEYHSKFENFRKSLPNLNPNVLSKIFFKWMTKEAPSFCGNKSSLSSALKDCDFSEVWPADTETSSYKEWNLFLNDQHWLGWKSDPYLFMVSRNEVTALEAKEACLNFSQKFGVDFRVFSEDDFKDLKIHYINAFVTNRNNLDYVGDDANDAPFFAQAKDKYFLWSPDLSGEYVVQNRDWNNKARAMCIAILDKR